jgi:hypothetical protein
MAVWPALLSYGYQGSNLSIVSILTKEGRRQADKIPEERHGRVYNIPATDSKVPGFRSEAAVGLPNRPFFFPLRPRRSSASTATCLK